MWSSAARSSIASPSAPLCESIETPPAGGQLGAKVALSDVAVSRTPMQLGPTMRMPAPRTISLRRASTFLPSAEISANPAVITTTPRTPARAHSRSTSSTAGAGTATTTRSTCAPIAVTLGKHFTPWISVACALTAYTRPRKPHFTMLSRMARPIESSCREAPTTATEAGSKMARTLSRAARRSRSVLARRNASVASVGNVTWKTPSLSARFTTKPLSAKTSIIRELSARTSASMRSTPDRAAISARRSSRSVPMPRPWYASSTVNATSARGEDGETTP